jgi:hypothetical protein
MLSRAAHRLDDDLSTKMHLEKRPNYIREAAEVICADRCSKSLSYTEVLESN